MSGEKSKVGDEFFKHKERTDGARDLYHGDLGGAAHGHAVIDKNGNVKYLRESDGHVIADDKIKP